MIGIALTATGVALSSPIMLVLGVVTLGAGVVAWSLMSKREESTASGSELGAEARWLLRPIRELRESLQKIASDRSASPDVSVIAQEAVAESDSIYQKAIELATAREGLKKSLKGQGEAETNLGRLERQIVEAKSDGERTALESAITARKQEIAAYAAAKSKIDEIDSRINLATASLSEIKARLVTGAVIGGTLEGHQDEFQDMIVRLKSLGQSFDEAQDMLEVKS